MLPPDSLASHSRLIDAEGHEALFRQMLGDVDEPTAPFGVLSTPGEGDPIEEACVSVGTSFARSLMAVANRTGVTTASLFHVAWAQVLARVSGREDVVFGTTGLDTPHRSEDVGGVGTRHRRILPIRISVGEESVGATVRRTHEILLALRDHAPATLALAQSYSAVPANVPLFSATLAYCRVQEAKAGYREGLGLRGSGASPNGKAQTDYPFTLLIGDLRDDFVLGVQAPASIDAMRVWRFVSTALEQLVEALEQKPSAPICTLDIVPEAERREVLCGWNETVAEFPDNHCIQELFEEQVRKTPHALAVVAEDRLDYAELNRRANRLAHYLRELGVRPDTRVAICVERGVAMIVAVLAVLKAGGAYVPLDPAYPAPRLKFMLEDSSPLALLTQRHLHGLMPGVPKNFPVLRLDAATCPWHNHPETDLPRHATGVRPMHLAYVIYTSGSTGTPKGVQVEHRGLCNLATAQIRAFAVATDSRILQFASFSFDACISEIMMTLCQGAALYCAPPGETLAGEVLNRIVAQYGITHVTLPPAVLSGVPEGGLASIRTLILAGETLADTLASRWAIGRQLINAYGPTESTVCATVFHYQAGRADTPPIGRPIANARVYILDRRGRPTPIGVMGELYIGGAGVARGYLNRPELTQEKFLPDPFTPGPGVRMYRTGDLGRWLPDGNIEFLGRDDFQVKIRGFRIELGEIEARLVEHPSVHEALVIVRENTPGDKRLVAYYILDEKGDPAKQRKGAETFRAYLFARLPDYMVPAAYVPLKAFPLTPNGKVDRKALPVPSNDAYVVRGYEPPVGETETILADLWVELLKLDRVGRNDSFFDLGGHSLLAVRMIERVRELFSRQLALVSFIQTPTISYLADLLAGHKGTQLATLNQGSPSKSPLIWVAPEPWQPHFTTYLSPDRPVLSFAITEEELAAAAPTYRLKDLAACVVKGIRQARPNSSYILAGFCQTSLLAYECAQQLCKLGHEIPLLVMGDVMVPGHGQGLSFAERSKRRLEREAYYLSVMGRSAPSEWRRLLQLRVGGFRAMREHRTWVNLYQSEKKNTLVARELYQALIIAHLSYTPAPYHGRVLFIQSGERPRSDRWDNAASWGRLIDDLEVFDAPGDHTSLFREPHARFAANKLQLALDRVDQDDPFLTRCG
jgi:amino acid adenylation domain-containing protein